MIITLTGENDFERRAELKALIADFVAEHGDMALEQLDGETVELVRINEALQSVPFLASRKLVVLRSPSANKQFVENAAELLADLGETTDVVIVEPKLDKRLAYYKFLKNSTDFREFAAMDERGLARWLADAAKQKGGKMSQADAAYLVQRVGANQQLLANELDKLLLYQPEITRATVDLLTDQTFQSKIFDLLDAAYGGNKQRAIKLYEEQRAQKVDPLQIIAMLSWQLHVLALLVYAGNRSADAVAGEAKISPYTARKSQATARNLSKADIKRYVADLLDIDKRARREAIDLDDALQLYLLQL
ncbi:MAG TPA: DNA polymerase III subunit delta [Candidatus Saccharimonadales bacterium]|nr:DNA polymerase III subunit delta [Candidatus Saccharimonadales bacterium]